MQILRDAHNRPDLFHWAGCLDSEALESWLRERRLPIGTDLELLLGVTGGGDMFETETLLRPFGGEALGDNADLANEAHHQMGLPEPLWLFHTGLVLSAVVRPQGTLVTLSDSYSALETYRTVDDWYIKLLRNEYMERYGLEPVGS